VESRRPLRAKIAALRTDAKIAKAARTPDARNVRTAKIAAEMIARIRFGTRNLTTVRTPSKSRRMVVSATYTVGSASGTRSQDHTDMTRRTAP
jgi:hypothetical protein